MSIALGVVRYIRYVPFSCQDSTSKKFIMPYGCQDSTSKKFIMPYCCQDSTSRFWVIISLMISVSILAPSPRGLTRVLMRRACTRCQESMLGVMF